MARFEEVAINWDAAFDSLFREIDGPKGSEFYYGGREFLEKLAKVKEDVPDYKTLIAQRRATGRDTSRRSYFRDLLYELEEGERVQFVLNIIADLEARGHPLCEEIRRLIGRGTLGPTAVITREVWNGERLNGFLSRIEAAVNLKQPGVALTLCYTCMEGFLKAYIQQQVPAEASEKEITALARIVQKDLKRKHPEYPGELFNVLTQTAHALNRTRDLFSDSHFGEQADLWAAWYLRDLLNTHIRLLLHFM